MIQINFSALPKFWSIPTWLLYFSIKNYLPPDHSWYCRNYNLHAWHKGCTKFSHQMNFLFWVWALGVILLIIIASYGDYRFSVVYFINIIYTIILYFRLNNYISDIEEGNRSPGNP